MSHAQTPSRGPAEAGAKPASAQVPADNPKSLDALDSRWSGLMVRAQGGDAQAYTILLTECRPQIRRVCERRLRDPAEAEDAVQDALLTLHLIRHTYDPARPFRPWLIAIAERRAIDRGRRRARRTRNEGAFATESIMGQAPPDVTPFGSDMLAENQLRAALASLPAAQRTALGLTKLQELSLEQASRRSGMTAGALKAATWRAMGALRRMMGSTHDERR